MTIRAVLFDLDGVLVSTDQLHYRALNAALQDHGCIKIEERQHKELYNGLPTTKKLELLADRGLVNPSDMGMIATTKQRYTLKYLDEIEFDPAVFCLLCGLRYGGLRIGVVSNAVATTVWNVLDKLNLRGLIEIVTSNEDGPPKPAPDLYLLACQRFGLDPKECLAVEDGRYGIESATDAGCKVLAVSGPAQVTPEAIWKYLEG